MIMGPKQSLDDGGKVQENRLLLQSLTTYIVKDNRYVPITICNASNLEQDQEAKLKLQYNFYPLCVLAMWERKLRKQFLQR